MSANNINLKMNYDCVYNNFYLNNNNEICFNIPSYTCREYLMKLRELCENIILSKKITWNDSENKYVKCLSTVSFDWINQTFDIDLCFGWWLEKIIKHVKWLEYFVIKDDYNFDYIKGFEIVHDEYYNYSVLHKIFDDTIEDFIEILYPIHVELIYENQYYSNLNNLDTRLYISYSVKSQYINGKVVPITDENKNLILSSTGKPFEDTNDYIFNTSQAVFKHLYDLQQAMKNNHMSDKLTSQINAVTTRLDKFDLKHKNDYEHMIIDLETCESLINNSAKHQKVYRDETNLYVNDLQDRISRLESLLCDNVDSQIIDRILNINKESESFEQIVKKQRQTIDELQAELKKQREEFEEYKSQRQQQLAAIMSQM